MKTELTDVSETRKTIRFEIPSDVVDAEITRVTHGYSRQARLPGFRPGKVPPKVIKQRFRDQILHDVMHGLIPKAVEDALTERGIDPVDTPDIRDVTLNEGEPLTFTAAIETIPSFDPGDLSAITLTRPPTTIGEHAIDAALERLRQRAAKYEPVEGRPAAEGDTVVGDMERKAGGDVDRHVDVEVELGHTMNPPGMDEQLIGLSPGDDRTFTIHFPEGYPSAELAGTDVEYTVRVKQLRRKVLPALDDEFAKDLGEESLDALRERVTADLQAGAEEAASRQIRNDLLRHLAERVSFEVPAPLIDREVDRRLEEFVRQLIDQRIDPSKVGIDWREFRERQRDAARAAVASALVLDEIARREQLAVEDEDIEKEIQEFASRAKRTPAAVRAQIEKEEGGVTRLSAGLRREKAIDLALSRAKMSGTDDPHQVIGEP